MIRAHGLALQQAIVIAEAHLKYAGIRENAVQMRQVVVQGNGINHIVLYTCVHSAIPVGHQHMASP